MPQSGAVTSWTIEIADGEWGAGYYPSIALKPDGWPAISYVFPPNRELRYAWRDSTGWHNTTIDRKLGGDDFAGTSLAINSTGIPHISYIVKEVFGVQTVMYVYWDAVLTSWVREMVSGAGSSLDRGQTSIAIDSQGKAGIAFVDVSSGNLMYAARNDGTWVTEYVHTAGFWPGYTMSTSSLKMDSLDKPHVAYFDSVNGTLRHAVRSGPQWLIETVDATSSDVGLSPSLALDSLDRPRIAYVETTPQLQLRYAERIVATWDSTTVPNTMSVESPSIALDSAGRPHIGYFNNSPHDLMYAHWTGTTWQVQLVDSDNGLWYTNTAVDSLGAVHIAYFHRMNGLIPRLKYAKGVYVNDPPASNILPIAPYWRNAIPLIVGATASDPDGSVITVDLWYRFDGGAGWGPWIRYGSDNAPPWQWSFSFPDGEGRYEFYSLSFDGTDWEAKASAAEASAGYDVTPPTSTALQVIPYWWITPSLIVNASASDNLSGVLNVTLFHAFSPDNLTWGSCLPFGTDSGEPWSWPFAFPDGEGHYKFHTIAADVAGNVEGGKSCEEAMAAHRIPYPDLTPLSLATVPPSPVPEMTVSDVSVTVANEGDMDAGEFDVLVFDDSNSNGQPEGGESIATSHVSSLASHSRTSVSAPWTATLPGSHRICAYADPPLGTIVESDETNNVMCVGVMVQPGPVLRPDYLPVSPLPLPPVRAGKSSPVSLSVQVRNQGNGTATDDTIIAFHEQSSSPFSTFVLGPLAPATDSSRLTATWLSPAAPGTYVVSADVDYYDNVTEWDETNNVYSWTIQVVSGPITSLIIGSPNYTLTFTYIKSSTPLDFSVMDQTGTGTRCTNYSIDGDPWTNYTATGTFFLTGDGEHTIDWFSEDYAGNVESVNSVVLRVDDTPPDTKMLIGDPNYLVGGNFINYSTPLTLQATDGGITPVGLDLTKYSVDGGSWTNYSSPLFLTSEGPHTIDYYSYDLLANAGKVRSLQVIVDDTPPTTFHSVGYPKHQAAMLFVRSSTAINLTSADGGVIPAGLAAILYRIDGGAPSTYTYNITLTGSDGPRTVYYRSRDLLGNEENQNSVALFLDDTPPVTMISPATGEFNATTQFALTATDGGSGVKVTRYRIDDGALTDYSIAFTVPVGVHNLSYYSVDNLDNSEQERRLTVTVYPPPPPNTPPTVTITSPIGGEEWLKVSAHTITWTMHDDEDANANLTVYLNYTTGGATYSIVTGLMGAQSFTWTLPDVEASDVLVNITVIDTGDLKGWNQSGPLTIKAMPPPPEAEANYKPLLAAIFATVLAVAGLWSSKKKSWKGGTGKKPLVKTFALASAPFIIVEAATGLLSLWLEPLRIPPFVGWGTAVDCAILAVGLVILTLGLVPNREGKVETQSN